jgi:pimeloyl-ACP methyl ester carboxylesterase
MLASVKVPVLLTHHARHVDPATGRLIGAMSDLQASQASEIIAAAGAQYEYVSLPDAAHAMHSADPPRFLEVLSRWAKALPA